MGAGAHKPTPTKAISVQESPSSSPPLQESPSSQPLQLPLEETNRAECHLETVTPHPPTLAGLHSEEACGGSGDASDQDMDGVASGEKRSSVHSSASDGSDAEVGGRPKASNDDQATSSSEAGFRAVIEHGYSQMSSEREEWLRSIGCTDRGPAHVPTILTAPAALRACGGGNPSKCPPEGGAGLLMSSKLSSAQQPWPVPVAQTSWDDALKERSTDIAEELKRWTERMGRPDWLPVEIS